METETDMSSPDVKNTATRNGRLELQREREHEKEMLQIKQAYMLKKYALFIVGASGIALLVFGAYLAMRGQESFSLLALFIMSGLMLLAFGVTVANAGISNGRTRGLDLNSNKAFFDELEKRK